MTVCVTTCQYLDSVDQGTVIPMLEFETRAKVQILAQITDEPSFDQLRTKEQLGYVVWSGARPSATTTGYRVLIQSERTPQYLESRIDAFLAKFKKDLAAMSPEDFEKHKKSLIARKLEKMKNLTSETGRLWSYVMGEAYNFFQAAMDAIATPCHLLCFSTLLGTQLYQSFIIVKVAFRALPRPAFISPNFSSIPEKSGFHRCAIFIFCYIVFDFT